ncbi:MAG: NAD(P)/FAD-dependent oxidoreductase [Nakamurella sp.]
MNECTSSPKRIVIIGGGYVGMYTALGLQRALKHEIRSGAVAVTVVDPQTTMTYQPFLPEAAAGNVEPRHVVVPLRPTLRHCRIITGAATAVNHAARTVTVSPIGGAAYQLNYDILVMAPGSVSRVLPIPGLAEHGIGFKTIGEAIALRNNVLGRLDFAASLSGSSGKDTVGSPGRVSAGSPDGDTAGSNEYDAARRRALTFVFVGGGYAGIEALGELENMARYATRYTPGVDISDMRWLLVEASDRVMPEVSMRMSNYTLEQLRERGIDVRLATRLNSVIHGRVELSDGDKFDADTVVWTAGVKPNPMLGNTDLPLDGKGRIMCDATLAVIGTPGVFAAGDCAAVPDVTKSDPAALCGPSAQHAVRQAKQLARNVAAYIRGGNLQQYRHAYAGSVASLGLYQGVAEIYGVRLRGFPAWWMHRTYHVSKMPTANRKIRIILDWTGGLLFRREVVSLGQLEQPRIAFEKAASQG